MSNNSVTELKRPEPFVDDPITNGDGLPDLAVDEGSSIHFQNPNNLGIILPIKIIGPVYDDPAGPYYKKGDPSPF